jgi:hypothetical protein
MPLWVVGLRRRGNHQRGSDYSAHYGDQSKHRSHHLNL